MARDPPSLTASSELRDLSLTPTAVRHARITIVHPQLRDLILPLERGDVLYPRGNSVEEQRWAMTDESDEEGGGGAKVVNGSCRTFAKLSFTPNCLTARGQIFACGGQHGELYMTNIPSSPKLRSLTQRFVSSPPTKPFSLSVTLPTRSINNSLTILPGWPGEWREKENNRRLSHIGQKQLSKEAADDWESGMDMDDPIDEEDIIMEDSEEEEEDDDDELLVGSPSSSVATYPNTVPFLHAPRIPNLPTSPVLDIPTTSSRRSTSFGGSERYHPRTWDRDRGSLSSSFDTPSHAQFVTSLPRRTGFHLDTHLGTSPSTSSIGSSKSKGRRREKKDEPRLLISNNDQTVKMFSLRSELPRSQSRSGHRDQRDNTAYGISLEATMRRDEEMRERAERLLERRGIRSSAPVPVPPPRFGSSFGWDNVGMNEGMSHTADEAMQRELQRARDHIRAEQETLRRERDDFERVVGMRVGVGSTGVFGSDSPPSPTPPVMREREERRLSKIGGSRFKYAINHSSLSPDLKTMVSVGDSTDVYLFEVIDGGREFRRIGTYNAATDSGFSTSWSKDGRKFAVASQDGQVTVWDHRSSRPLAIFHTSASPSHPSSPSFTSDLATSRHSPLRHRHTSPFAGPEVVLIDPVTGDSQTGSSTSGREAARVVKFSPEGSSRDLMVFTEENSNIHIIDARTFHTHVIVPVPSAVPNDPMSHYRERTGVEGGTWGVAGAAFDPTGDWLYSGTERTVVEWDLRRLGGGESGTWSMA